REGEVGAGDKKRHEHPESLAGQDVAEPGALSLGDGFIEAGSGHVEVPYAACSMAPVMRPVTSSGELSAIFLSATLRPRRMTMTRSATVKTSGMRWLIRTTAIPLSRSWRMRLRTSATCRTEMAAVGS